MRYVETNRVQGRHCVAILDCVAILEAAMTDIFVQVVENTKGESNPKLEHALRFFAEKGDHDTLLKMLEAKVVNIEGRKKVSMGT